jgi:hypothetical protein
MEQPCRYIWKYCFREKKKLVQKAEAGVFKEKGIQSTDGIK